MNEGMRFKNEYRLIIWSLAVIFSITSIFVTFVVSPATYLSIIFMIITISACLYWVITGGMRYAIIINSKQIKIFSKTYLISQIKFVELIPWTAPVKLKKDKLYGYIIFHIERPNNSKPKKIRIYGGCIDSHKKFVEALEKYGIKYCVNKLLQQIVIKMLCI